MSFHTIAILSPGEMGHAIGSSLINQGFNVTTFLKDRSPRTQQLSNLAGINDIKDFNIMVTEADLILSILAPSNALDVAGRVASALEETGHQTIFVDCNAVSPETATKLDSMICDTGSKFIDASIVGSPPGKGTPPRIYVSGRQSDLMKSLDGPNMTVISLGNSVGQASGLKMCYAALTKGTSALHIALLAAAETMGLSEELKKELVFSQSEIYRNMERQLPSIPMNAGRWVGEMEEISRTFERVGIPGNFHLGAAGIFDLLDRCHFAKETPENFDRNRTLMETVSVLADSLMPRPESI